MNVRFSVFWSLAGSLLASQVLAHAIISPTEGVSGARHKFYSIVAPNEKDVAVVGMKVEVPPEWKAAGGQINRVQRDPLWDITVDRDEDDWIRSITWSGSEAPGYSFLKFDLIVSLPDLAGMQQIKIWQTYADGSVVAWVEDRTGADVKKPAAGLMLTEAQVQSEPVSDDVGPSKLSLGLSGLLGGLIGGGLVRVTRRNNKKNSQ
jgi:hypothetical protein